MGMLTCWRARQLDPVSFTFPNLGMSNKKFRVSEITTRVDGVVPISLVVESPEIYEWNPAVDEKAPLNAVASTPYDYANNPFSGAG
ncbi:MAG: hypothetical protein U5N55_11730 [Cypionkella sp.]|nr:hypothetical protein [Cypionkella sp.]